MDAYNKQQLKEDLDNGLKYLTQEEKYVLFLTYYEDLNIAEVCAILSITPMQYDRLAINAKAKMRKFTQIFDDLDRKYAKDKL